MARIVPGARAVCQCFRLARVSRQVESSAVAEALRNDAGRGNAAAPARGKGEHGRENGFHHPILLPMIVYYSFLIVYENVSSHTQQFWERIEKFRGTRRVHISLAACIDAPFLL